ncbi:hypothetical protein GOV13_01265 [Candidatus Pacearchaeota archaeon]|nr:hypothetical protein [Candidatus Pacearchaeota archaeon]
MARYTCQECNFKFKSESNQTGKKCPYCRKPRVIKEPSAEDLLEEV